MPIFALITVAAAAVQGGSAPVYGPPAPSTPATPVIHALPDDGITYGININRTVRQVLSDIDRAGTAASFSAGRPSGVRTWTRSAGSSSVMRKTV